MKVKVVWLAVALSIIMVFAMKTTLAAQTAVPTGPDVLTVFNSSRYNSTNINGTSIQAEAGNVTGLVLVDIALTKAWAGYYGNVSGTIVLSDAGSNNLYTWAIASPTGEVYASNGSGVSWSIVNCVNLTANKSSNYPMNQSTLEAFFGIAVTDGDGVNETFNSTFGDTAGFYVSSTLIDDTDKCPMLFTHTSGAYQTTNFKEVLLTDNSSVIFTALLNDSQTGFKGGTELFDFQMLVTEDGHGAQSTSLTNYYFFVELA